MSINVVVTTSYDDLNIIELRYFVINFISSSLTLMEIN